MTPAKELALTPATCRLSEYPRTVSRGQRRRRLVPARVGSGQGRSGASPRPRAGVSLCAGRRRTHTRTHTSTRTHIPAVTPITRLSPPTPATFFSPSDAPLRLRGVGGDPPAAATRDERRSVGRAPPHRQTACLRPPQQIQISGRLLCLSLHPPALGTLFPRYCTRYLERRVPTSHESDGLSAHVIPPSPQDVSRTILQYLDD